MRISFLLTFLLLLAYSCSGDKNNFTVEVRESDTGGSMIYLAQRTLTGTVVVDSATPDKSGTYFLGGVASQPDFYIVYHNPRQYINLIIRPGDDFRVLTNGLSFDANYLVEGSKDSRLIQKMVNMQTRTLEKITEISTRYENSRGKKDFERIKAGIDSAYEQVVADHKKFSIELIKENPGSLVGLMALYQQLGRNAPVFNYRKDFRYYELVDSNLTSIYPYSEAVIDLNRKVTELRELLKLEIGSVAPEIALTDTSGQLIPLSSLRNRVVLLVFWASWSSQSVDEIREYARQLSKQGSTDLALYQVSLDRTRESWLNALSDKNIRGVNVSDLMYWDSPVVELYHIEKLPVTYLISKEGIIINRDFRADDFPELFAEIKE